MCVFGAHQAAHDVEPLGLVEHAAGNRREATLGVATEVDQFEHAAVDQFERAGRDEVVALAIAERAVVVLALTTDAGDERWGLVGRLVYAPASGDAPVAEAAPSDGDPDSSFFLSSSDGDWACMSS